ARALRAASHGRRLLGARELRRALAGGRRTTLVGRGARPSRSPRPRRRQRSAGSAPRALPLGRADRALGGPRRRSGGSPRLRLRTLSGAADGGGRVRGEERAAASAPARRGPGPVPFLSGERTGRLADRVVGLEGVLGFADGHFRVQPTGVVAFEERSARPPAPPRVGGLRIVTLNLDNYFVDLGSRGAADV